MAKEIIVTIGTDGGAEVQTKGYTGKSCSDASREIEKALGAVTSDRKTPEYYQQATTGNQQKARG